MNFTEEEIIIGVVILIILIFLFMKEDKEEETIINENNRIKDEAVNLSNVLYILSAFKYKMDEKLKFGYTEKSIQNQLKKHLLDNFESVISEYGIEGPNATKIDFDIGNGMVGLEIKIAKSVFKTSEFHRLSGQIDDYMNFKYGTNIIVAIFGEEKHEEERPMLKRVEDKVHGKGVVYKFIKIGKKEIEKAIKTVTDL